MEAMEKIRWLEISMKILCCRITSSVSIINIIRIGKLLINCTISFTWLCRSIYNNSSRHEAFRKLVFLYRISTTNGKLDFPFNILPIITEEKSNDSELSSALANLSCHNG